MSFMMTETEDETGSRLIASCPFYHAVPLCVNTCALFVPHETPQGELDYKHGHCGLVNGGRYQTLEAVDPRTEKRIMEKRGLF